MAEDNLRWKSFFEFIVGENKSKCKICSYKLNGNNDSNNKRHFVKKHREEAEKHEVQIGKHKTGQDSTEIVRKKAKLNPRGDYVRDCVGLVSLDYFNF